MKSKLSIAIAALLAAAALPAMALQLGEIQVKSALNQPLVAAIPLHPENLTELDGLTVGLASAEDFTRAGLPLTPTDQTLRFHVVSDNNGQKLILVTSSQPVTDPYLDFLVQVNTRQGKQVHEFVVLLNPVIASPAPPVQTAPVAAAPVASAQPATQQPVPVAPASPSGAAANPPAELPAPAQFPQPQIKPQPQPQAAPPPAVRAEPQPQRQPAPATSATASAGQVDVKRGDTLYGIAKQATENTAVSIDQMMLALQTANPKAFFKDNINALKAGAILRIPTREEIDRRSLAAAVAEVRRQYEAWQAAKPQPATIVEGTAAHAAANAAPRPGKAPQTSDHLTLVPPTRGAGGANSRPGVAGGTGTATVAGLRQQLQTSRDTLISLNQSNSDLESRVQSLQAISEKTGKLLSLKDATIAELQHKLAQVHSGTVAAATAVGTAPAASTATTRAAKAVAVPAAGATAARSRAAKAIAKPIASVTPWYMRPVTWIVAGIIVLALILLGLLGRRRPAAPEAAPRGPLADPDDVAPKADAATAPESEAAAMALAEGPLSEHQPASEPEPAPAVPDPLRPTGAAGEPYGLTAWYEPLGEPAAVVQQPVVIESTEPASALATAEATPAPATGESALAAEPAEAGYAYSDDPVDTKLDLARAYIDMGDPVGAQAMLEEVLEEGTQVQKDEAKRLMADVAE